MDYLKCVIDLIKILETPAKEIEEIKKQQTVYRAFLASIIEEGIERKQYFIILQELLKLYNEKKKYDLMDELYEMETSITGNCSEFYIPRFNNEPVDHKAFVS